MPFDPSDGIFTMFFPDVLLFHSLSANLHFHCCLDLFYFVLIVLVLRYSCCVYLQNFTQHHITAAAKTKKSVGKSCVIFLTLISYHITQHWYICSFYSSTMVIYIFSTIANSIIRNNKKERLWLIWFSCYIVSTLSFILCYLFYR